MENRKLEVGDRIYGVGNYGIRSIDTIKRVTPTQAIVSEFMKFKRETKNGDCNKIGRERYCTVWYYVETEELKQKYKSQLALKQISSIYWEKVEPEKIDQILEILK